MEAVSWFGIHVEDFVHGEGALEVGDLITHFRFGSLQNILNSFTNTLLMILESINQEKIQYACNHQCIIFCLLPADDLIVCILQILSILTNLILSHLMILRPSTFVLAISNIIE